MTVDEICNQHSGCLARIEDLEDSKREHSRLIGRQTERIDQVLSRLNLVLGTVAAACILLVVNILAGR
jgi:hypothetical protein